MNFYLLLAIGGGATLGAWLRWGLSLWLNPLFPSIPLGTLAANLLGGFLIGALMGAVFAQTALPVTLRIALSTGFLGGLTTFSTFSAETVALLLAGKYLWVAAITLIHVIGSLSMTLLGIFVMRLLTSAT